MNVIVIIAHGITTLCSAHRQGGKARGSPRQMAILKGALQTMVIWNPLERLPQPMTLSYDKACSFSMTLRCAAQHGFAGLKISACTP